MRIFQTSTGISWAEVSSEGIKVSPVKIEAIKLWPVPRTVRQVRSFVGLANFYRKFIKGFSEIAKTLTELTKKMFRLIGRINRTQP